MSGHYKTVFSIEDPRQIDPLSGHSLLRRAVKFIVEKLSADQGQPPLEREFGDTEDVAYAVVRTERPVSGDGGIVARLEIRLWADDGEVHLAMESHVIAPDEEADQSYLYSPPRIVSALTERYRCAGGQTPISPKRPEQLPTAHLTDLLFKSRRQLPVLLISPGRGGNFPAHPQRMAEQLLGLAHVAIAEYADRSALGSNVHCFNGASRIIWTRASPNNAGLGLKTFFMPQEAANKDLPARVRDALLKTPPDFSDFEDRYRDIRSHCVYRRNLQLERELTEATTAPPAAMAPPPQDHLRTLRRELRKSERQRKSLESHNSRLQDEINSMQTEITNLNRPLTVSPTVEPLPVSDEFTRKLQADLAEKRLKTAEKDAEIKRLQEKIDSQNIKFNDLATNATELQTQLRKQNFMGGISPPFKRLTSLNHALNVARDPIRKYIVQNLRQANSDNVFQCFQHSINMEFISPVKALQYPESVIDFGDFPDLVKHNPEAFDDADNLYALLEKTRRDRNKIIHPDLGAANVTDQLARELINNIISINRIIGRRSETIAA